MNYEDFGRAIAAFERTLVFVDSPFRRSSTAIGGHLGPGQAGWTSSTARPAAWPATR